MESTAVLFLAVLGIAQGVLISNTCDTIKMFVDEHNRRRLLLAQGKVDGQPAATRMKYMTWDEELAEKAANWASKHMLNYNPDKTIPSRRFETGENIVTFKKCVRIQLNLDHMVYRLEQWWKEHQHYTFGDVPKENTRAYSQMAWANSDKLGCAISKNKGISMNEYFCVCNYGPAGNIIDTDNNGEPLGAKPYVPGQAANQLVSEVKEAKPYGISCTEPTSKDGNNTTRTSIPYYYEQPVTGGTQPVFNTHTISLILIITIWHVLF